MNKRWWGKRD